MMVSGMMKARYGVMAYAVKRVGEGYITCALFEKVFLLLNLR